MAILSSFRCCFLLFILFCSPFCASAANLSLKYYEKTCPNFGSIVRDTVTTKQLSNPTTAAATLRLFFHDCVVGGCDASVLISSNSFNKAERDAHPNLSLAGDGFEVIVRAKTALELACPGIVSCADILAEATRDLVTVVGGPFYEVLLGRKDSLTSKAEGTDPHLPVPTMNMDQIIALFTAQGFSAQEMVALTGSHTIGFTHCNEFADRLYKYSKTNPTDPRYHPTYAAALKKMCENYTTDTGMSAFNDVMTPSKFDNMYFKNLQRGLGLLASDAAMTEDARTKPFVELYAANQTAFFNDFRKAMEKLSVMGIKTEGNGEVRLRCDSFNSIKT